jgi:hypothetical protein
MKFENTFHTSELPETIGENKYISHLIKDVTENE